MIPPPPPAPGPNRRLLLVAAALGGVLVGLLALRMLSGGDDDLAVGIAPVRAPVPTQTTTTTTVGLPPASSATAPLPLSTRDPFGQIVTVADGPHAGPATAATQGALAPSAPTAQSTPTTVRAPAPTTTATTRPAPTSTVAQAPTTAVVAPGPVAPRMVTGLVGPVAVPGQPVHVCVDDGTRNCTTTAPATAVSVVASATVDPAAATIPTVVPAACSNGQGAALLVHTGSAGTTVHVSVTAVVNGVPTLVALGLPAPAADQSLIISACVAPGVGVPSTGAPAPPGGGSPLDALLQSLLGLLAGRA